MNCYYCDQIHARDEGYPPAEAQFDLGSAAPRCPRHWRYLCGACGKPAHFMASAWCPRAARFFCSKCAHGVEQVAGRFWAWSYHFRYRSPWSDLWEPSLDYLEFQGMHPLQRGSSALQAMISREPWLERYPVTPTQWRLDHMPSDEEIRASWNANAERWTATYNEDGDITRRTVSDEPLLRMLGEVRQSRILDIGCGNGYLCRKLAKMGAHVAGVEPSDEFLRIAQKAEAQESLGITYHHGSATQMSFIKDQSFDKAVANFVLMDIRDYELAVAEASRVLVPGGIWVVVISPPMYTCGETKWERRAPDSPRREERGGMIIDNYFQRGPFAGIWGKLDPVISFHRPLRDYFETFRGAGFSVDEFEEPTPTENGLREFTPAQVETARKFTYCCIFKLTKRGK